MNSSPEVTLFIIERPIINNSKPNFSLLKRDRLNISRIQKIRNSREKYKQKPNQAAFPVKQFQLTTNQEISTKRNIFSFSYHESQQNWIVHTSSKELNL